VFVLRLRHPEERRLIAALGQVAVDAVEARIQAPPDEPLPERRVAGVERRVPVRVPVEQVSVLLEALRKVLLAEPLQDGRVGRVRLSDETWRGPTGSTELGDSPWTTPAAEAYHAAAAVTMPAQPPACRIQGVPPWASRKKPIASKISVISRVRKTMKTATLIRRLQSIMYVLK